MWGSSRKPHTEQRPTDANFQKDCTNFRVFERQVSKTSLIKRIVWYKAKILEFQTCENIKQNLKRSFGPLSIHRSVLLCADLNVGQQIGNFMKVRVDVALIIP